MRLWLTLLACGIVSFAGGCFGDTPIAAHSADGPSAEPSHFNPRTAGSIRGTVLWDGPLPDVPPFEVQSFVCETNPPHPHLMVENPNRPRIDPASRGVEGAVVFLRRVDPDSACAWSHEPVSIEQRGRRLLVMQGTTSSNIGFVKRGAAVTMVSREKVYNSLHACGASYFSLAFPDPDRPLARALAKSGLVELSSGAGWYWMRAYLFVDDQPYYTRTDGQGRFQLDKVPPGQYQLVCWMPNWNKQGQDRDSEILVITRMWFHSPVEIERDIEVEAGAEAACDFHLREALFKR